MENKYYTPSIEDIRVGYECEFWGMTVGGLFFFDEPEKNVEPSIPVWYPMIVGTDVWTTRSVKDTVDALGRGQIRTPYLTKEQIEKEGWEYSDIHSKNRLRPILFKNNHAVILYGANPEKPVIEFWVKDPTIIKYEYHTPELIRNVFPCSSINEFRYFCKILGV